MFENYQTLMALNAERIRLCSEDNADVLAINNAYNAARMHIMQNSVSNYKPVKLTPLVTGVPVLYKMLPIAGTSDKLGVIQVRADGLYI